MYKEVQTESKMSFKKRGFCRFYKQLYYGQSVKNHVLVKWKLKTGRGQFGLYCVVKAEGGLNQLELINCAFLRQKYYLYHPAYVYGIAGGYEEAMDIILRISQEASIAGMDGRLLDYLLSKEA